MITNATVRFFLSVLAAAAIASAPGIAFAAEGIAPAEAPAKSFTSTVKKVISGDEVVLSDGRTLRYIGIDAPKTTLPKKDARYYGKDAFEFNRNLVEGKEVKIETDILEKDKKGRLLGYVFSGDLFVNGEIVKNGFAMSAKYPPNVRYQDRLDEMEKEAKLRKAGIWAGAEKVSTGAPKQDIKGVREGVVEKVINGDTFEASIGRGGQADRDNRAQGQGHRPGSRKKRLLRQGFVRIREKNARGQAG